VIAANGTFPVWPENPAFTFRVIFWNRTEQSLLPVGPARLLRGGKHKLRWAAGPTPPKAPRTAARRSWVYESDFRRYNLGVGCYRRVTSGC
jgi:hypothetical protein